MGSVSPCPSSSRVSLPSSVFFSEPSNQFPSTDRATWDYGYAGCRCRRKTLAEASEKLPTQGLQVKEADFALLFRNVRSDVRIVRREPPASVRTINTRIRMLQKQEHIFGKSCVDFEALMLVNSAGRK